MVNTVAAIVAPVITAKVPASLSYHLIAVVGAAVDLSLPQNDDVRGIVRTAVYENGPLYTDFALPR